MRTLAPDCIKLGFGMMRLPKREDGTIDVETTAQMVDEFLAAGGKYVDTAFVYEGSEDAVRQALVEHHPRDSYYLATKLNAGEWAAKDEAAAKAEFEQSLPAPATLTSICCTRCPAIAWGCTISTASGNTCAT